MPEAPELAVRSFAYSRQGKKLRLTGVVANGADVTVTIDDDRPVNDVIRNGNYWFCVLHKYNGIDQRTIKINNRANTLTVHHQVKIKSRMEGGFTVDEFTYDAEAQIAYASGIAADGVTITVTVDSVDYDALAATDHTWSRSFPLTRESNSIRITSNSDVTFIIDVTEFFNHELTLSQSAAKREKALT